MTRLNLIEPGYNKIKGNLPAGWKAKKISEVISDIGDGGTPSRKNNSYFGGNIPWVVIEDITRKIEKTTECLTEEGFSSSNTKKWPIGTLILSFGATIGKVGIANIEVTTKQGIAGIIPDKNETTSEFLYYLFQYHQKILEKYCHKGTLAEIRPGTIKELMFAFPPLEEQNKIVKVLSTIDDKYEFERQDLILKLKEGFMQLLLTGSIRVNNLGVQDA
tara:strand:+ start:1798 stop:2451 length:654 start_codon:yes stop_codon:yes gene_type:complete